MPMDGCGCVQHEVPKVRPRPHACPCAPFTRAPTNCVMEWMGSHMSSHWSLC